VWAAHCREEEEAAKVLEKERALSAMFKSAGAGTGAGIGDAGGKGGLSQGGYGGEAGRVMEDGNADGAPLGTGQQESNVSAAAVSGSGGSGFCFNFQL
jgi:hypothetical protein